MTVDKTSGEVGHTSVVKTAANGVSVDIGRPYYDPDPTVIQDELTVLEFEGGFGTFTGGQNYARTFGQQAFARAVAESEDSLRTALGLSRDEAMEILRESEHLDVLARFNAGFFQFIEGLAAETSIPVEDLVIALNDGVFFAIGVHDVRDELLAKLGFSSRGCTVAAFDNGTLGQNNDNPVKYSGASVLVKSLDDKVMLLTIGSPLVMLMGMSEHVAVCANTLDAFFAGHSLRDEGLPDAALLMHALLSCRSVDGVVAQLRDAKMNVALALTFADKAGGLATIEFNAKQFIGNIIIRPAAGEHHIAHTNHPRFSEEYLTSTWFDGDRGKADQMTARTFWRQEFAENFLATSVDRTVEELQQLFSVYPTLYAGSDGLDFRTTVSVIWSITEQAAFVAPDRPDITTYQRIDWTSN